MIVSTRSIVKVAKVLGKDNDARHYQEWNEKIKFSLEEHFWDPDKFIFDDFYYVKNQDNSTAKQFNGHCGYLNFFPIFLNAIQT